MNKYLVGLGAVLLLIGVWLPQIKPQIGGGILGRNQTSEITLFTTSTNANYSTMTPTNVASYRNIGITLVGDSASGTLKFFCSNQTDIPSVGTASSTSNRWDNIEVVEKEDGSAIDGDTGVTLSNTTDVRLYEVNDNYCVWFWAELSGNTTPAGLGTTTLYVRSATNE